jgi:phage replication O-like protein O
MANPQRENGHVDIANEIMDELAQIHLSGAEWQLLITVFRKTWGWHKKHDWISLTQFERATGLSRWGVCIAKKRLVNKNILIAAEKSIRFNKNYDQWVVNKTRPVNKSTTGSQQNDNRVVNKTRHTKETITKETITKESNASLESFEQLKNPQFKELWDAWLEIRKKIRAPNTHKALELTLKKLQKYPIETAKQMLEQSIERGWRGVFPVKRDHQAAPQTQDFTHSEIPERPKINAEGLQKVHELVQGAIKKIDGKDK